MNRRDFLQATAAGLALSAASGFSAEFADQKAKRVGLIGCGWDGKCDLFRHWILGLGSGDLVVKTTGAQMHEFDLHNVLFIGKKVKQIEDMLKKRVVVQAR